MDWSSTSRTRQRRQSARDNHLTLCADRNPVGAHVQTVKQSSSSPPLPATDNARKSVAQRPLATGHCLADATNDAPTFIARSVQTPSREHEVSATDAAHAHCWDFQNDPFSCTIHSEHTKEANYASKSYLPGYALIAQGTGAAARTGLEPVVELESRSYRTVPAAGP